MKFLEEKDAKKEIGRRIKEKIYAQGFNYSKLSAETGISESYISRICSGYYIPSIETLYNITKPLTYNWKELLEDLEYWITPKGFNFDSKDITEEDKERYYNQLFKEIDLLKIEDIKNRESKDDISNVSSSGNKIILRVISNDRYEVKDNSMNLLGINIDSFISYYAKKVPVLEHKKTLGDFFDFNSLYVIKFKASRRPILRKIYVERDFIIAIPFSKSSSFKPESFKYDEIEGVYKAVSMTTNFKDTTNPHRG